MSLSYHHQGNGQMEACIKCVKCTIKKCRQTTYGVEIRSTLVNAGLPSSDMILFNIPIRALLPQVVREPINVNNNNEHYEAFKSRQESCSRSNDTHKNSTLFSLGSPVVA